MAVITRYLPRKILSRWVGFLVHLKLPLIVRWPVMWLFARAYKINLAEAEKPLRDYPSLGEFFVRGLKPHVRPLGDHSLLHCADSVVTQIGLIHQATAVQAKGKIYSLAQILGESEIRQVRGAPSLDVMPSQDSSLVSKLEGGLFLTYYLCPTDYHRVHAPADGEIVRVKYIPGDLWPVNEWSTHHVSELFCLNERMVIEMKTSQGPLVLVLVGATNVGFIELAFDASLKANQGQPARERKYAPTVKVKKGEELGRFRMGSTVVAFLSPEWVAQFPNIVETQSRLLGSPVNVRSNFR